MSGPIGVAFDLAYLAVAVITWRQVYVSTYTSFAPQGWDDFDRGMCALLSTVAAILWPLTLLMRLVVRGLRHFEGRQS